MISGVVDIKMSDSLNPYTCGLTEALKESIVRGIFNPFDGELRSQNGLVKKAGGKDLSSLDIIKMDWLLENIEGEIPALDSLTDEAKKTVKVSGVKGVKRK